MNDAGVALDGISAEYIVAAIIAAVLLLMLVAPKFCEQSVRWVTNGGCALIARVGAGASRAMVDIHGRPVPGQRSVRSVLAVWWKRTLDAFEELTGRSPHATKLGDDQDLDNDTEGVTP